MSEYADYLLTAIDNCYGIMKKRQPDLVQRIVNPCSLFGGTISEEVECVCDVLDSPDFQQRRGIFS